MDENDIPLIKYAIRSIWNDISKLILYSLIALLTSTWGLFLAVCVPYISVRVFMGGMHMKTYWVCFFFTGTTLIFMMILSVLLYDNLTNLFYVTVISLVMILVIGPVVSINKKRVSKCKRYIFSGITLIIEIVFMVIAFRGVRNPVN